jgi:hypothetical protein
MMTLLIRIARSKFLLFALTCIILLILIISFNASKSFNLSQFEISQPLTTEKDTKNAKEKMKEFYEQLLKTGDSNKSQSGEDSVVLSTYSYFTHLYIFRISITSSIK